MTIATVTGRIEPDELGFTLMHEHVFVTWDGTFLDSRLRFDWEMLEATAVERLSQASQCGVRTLVDMTTIEMGRDVARLRRLSDATGVQIVCCTGLFAEAYGIPYYFRTLSEADLTDLFVSELREGIGDTGVRAGAIKVATSGGTPTELEERIIRAAATAQRLTDVPVLTHTGHGEGGERQVELLCAGGVPPSRIVVGHADVSLDLRYHRRLLRMGVAVGFDRIGLEAFAPDVFRAECLAALIRNGYESQLTMSMDAQVRWLGPETGLASLERDYTHLHREFFPLLRRAGVDDGSIERVMVENPRRIFSADGEVIA
jgi:phosphotriesterase-related protein